MAPIQSNVPIIEFSDRLILFYYDTYNLLDLMVFKKLWDIW